MLSRFFTVFIANSAIFWSMIGFCSKLCLTSYCSTDIKNLWFLHTGGTIFPECVSYFPGNTLVDLVATKQQHFNGILKKKKKITTNISLLSSQGSASFLAPGEAGENMTFWKLWGDPPQVGSFLMSAPACVECEPCGVNKTAPVYIHKYIHKHIWTVLLFLRFFF